MGKRERDLHAQFQWRSQDFSTGGGGGQSEGSEVIERECMYRRVVSPSHSREH